jgi:hypothetical protein
MPVEMHQDPVLRYALILKLVDRVCSGLHRDALSPCEPKGSWDLGCLRPI